MTRHWLGRACARCWVGLPRARCAQCVGEAANAVEAMALIQHHRVDVVLIDIHMPGADGLALARALRALEHPPALIFVTAHAEHAVEAFELEAVDYLTKPVRLERLQQALQKVERTISTTRPGVQFGTK
jgi:two-component system response regulator AlgR